MRYGCDVRLEGTYLKNGGKKDEIKCVFNRKESITGFTFGEGKEFFSEDHERESSSQACTYTLFS